MVSNNVMPLNEPLPVVGGQRTIELPAVAVDVPAGQTLFLTVSRTPWSACPTSSRRLTDVKAAAKQD